MSGRRFSFFVCSHLMCSLNGNLVKLLLSLLSSLLLLLYISCLLFAFSYSYDLTHSLQYNMAPVRHINDMADVTTAAPWPPGGAGENVEDEGSHVEEACTFTLCGEEGDVDGSQQLPDMRTETEGKYTNNLYYDSVSPVSHSSPTRSHLPSLIVWPKKDSLRLTTNPRSCILVLSSVTILSSVRCSVQLTRNNRR